MNKHVALTFFGEVCGLERSKLKQMTLQFIQNAGEDGTMRYGIYEYLKVAMLINKTKSRISVCWKTSLKN